MQEGGKVVVSVVSALARERASDRRTKSFGVMAGSFSPPFSPPTSGAHASAQETLKDAAAMPGFAAHAAGASMFEESTAPQNESRKNEMREAEPCVPPSRPASQLRCWSCWHAPAGTSTTERSAPPQPSSSNHDTKQRPHASAGGAVEGSRRHS